MKLFCLCLLIGCSAVLQAQMPAGDTITKRMIVELGYVSEYVDGGGSGLNGFEGQLKFLFGKHPLAKGEKLSDALYYNLGYSYFPASAYTLGQINTGLGFTGPAPLLGQFLNMDFGLGAAYYHGTLGDTKWAGTKIDFGGYIGLSISFGRRGGIYGKFAMPGFFSTLADENYITPMLISAGLRF